MDDSDPNGEKSTVVALAELVDQHASITRTLKSKLTALEDARKEIAELERQKERTLSELLVLVVKKIGEIENNFNAPKDVEVEKKVNAPIDAEVRRTETTQSAEKAVDLKEDAVKHTFNPQDADFEKKANVPKDVEVEKKVNAPIDAEICQTETKQSTEKAVDLKEDVVKQTFNPQDADVEKNANAPKDAEVFQTETTQSTEKAVELKEEVINRSSPLRVGPKIMNSKAESAVPGGKGQAEENKMPPQFVPAKQWEMMNVPMDAEVEKKVNAVLDAEVCRNETTQSAEKAVESKEEAVKRTCNPQDAEVKKKVNAPVDAEVIRTETMMSSEVVVSKEESVKCTSNPRVRPTKLAKKRAAVSKKGQSEVKKQPRSVPVKPWERHRCLKPYKPIPATNAQQIVSRRIAFYVNACTFNTVKNTVKLITISFDELIRMNGGFTTYNSIVAGWAWAFIARRAMSEEMLNRTYVALLKQLSLRRENFCDRYDLSFYLAGITGNALNQLIEKSKLRISFRCEKQTIVNILCFLGELHNYGLVRERRQIDIFSHALLQFNQRNCGFARKILAKLYKIHERGLWCISERYSDDDENYGKPVTPPVTRIHLKPRELLPTAVDRGKFGKTLKSAPIELKTLVGWMFVQFPTAPRLDRDLTVLLNSISHKDLQVKRYNVINWKTYSALTENERPLFPEKVITALVVRALTSPLKSTSLYVRLLTETAKKFVSNGLIYQEHVEEFHSESIFVLVHTILVASLIWQRGGQKLERCLKDCPVKVREKLSKFFTKISEHGFYRVAWFLFCLRDHGNAQSYQMKDLRTRLGIDTRPNHSKFRLLTKWLHELDRGGYIGLEESPLNLEENFGSSDHCRRCSGPSAC